MNSYSQEADELYLSNFERYDTLPADRLQEATQSFTDNFYAVLTRISGNNETKEHRDISNTEATILAIQSDLEGWRPENAGTANDKLTRVHTEFPDLEIQLMSHCAQVAGEMYEYRFLAAAPGIIWMNQNAPDEPGFISNIILSIKAEDEGTLKIQKMLHRINLDTLETTHSELDPLGTDFSVSRAFTAYTAGLSDYLQTILEWQDEELIAFLGS